MPGQNEFARGWRAFLAAFLGLGSALSLNSFILAAFGPAMRSEFHWTAGDWARTGSVVMVAIFFVPFYGRLADRFGVRRIALIGIIGFPLTCIAFTLMGRQLGTGIWTFVWIYALQSILGCSTTQTVYTRLVAGSFERWRGIALGMCASGPALFGGIINLMMPQFVADHGWRAGYLLTAAFSILCGVATLALLSAKPLMAAAQPAPRTRAAWSVYTGILSMPVFWFIFVACFLVNVHGALLSGQFKPLLISHGASDAGAGALIFWFTIGMIVGRFVSGLALDHFPAHRVAALFLALPSIGIAILLSSMHGYPALLAAMIFVGLAYGGEGDVMGYLVARYFGFEIYGTVLGLVTSGIALASTLGHWISGAILDETGSFDPFLMMCAVTILIGGLMFLGLGRFAPAARDMEQTL